MALIPYFEPYWSGSGAFTAPVEVGYVKAQGAVWRQGSILVSSSAAVLVPSGGLGTLIAAAGPISTSGTLTTAGQTIVTTTVTATGSNVVTITAVAAAGAAAASYWNQLTFVNTAANESITGPEFVVNTGPGIIYSVNVSAAGAPAAASNYAVYTGIVPQNEVLQTATKVGTALGTALTLTSPLAFNKGILQAATNANSNIVGIAVNASDQYFISGPGGATTVNNQSMLGATVSLPPTQPQELYFGYVAKLQNAYIEMSLINTQAWSPALIGSNFGLTLDATTGFFVANPAGTACGFIVNGADGVPSIVGTSGDFGKRIIVQFNVGLI